MAYGLPTRGQADWDDELNNSVEALRSDVQTATADATVARSNSTQAISIAQDAAARVEEVSGLTGEDDAIALLQADDDSATAVATDARVETKVAADVVNDASPIGAALSSTFAPLPDNGGQAVGQGEIFINVKDYGATGDGTTDDSTAVVAALAAAAGGTCHFPKGTYNIAGTPLAPASGTRLSGNGYNSIIKSATAANLINIDFVGNIRVENLTLDLVSSANQAIRLAGSTGSSVTNVNIINGGTGTGVGVISGSAHTIIRGLRVTGCKYAVLVNNGSTDTRVSDFVLQSGTDTTASVGHLYVPNGVRATFTNGIVTGAAGHGAWIGGATTSDVELVGVTFRANGTTGDTRGVTVDSSVSRVKFVACSFVDNYECGAYVSGTPTDVEFHSCTASGNNTGLRPGGHGFEHLGVRGKIVGCRSTGNLGDAANEGVGFYVGTNGTAVLNSDARGNWSAGIRAVNANRALIEGNRCSNNSQRGAGLHDGIEVNTLSAGASKGVQVIGNHCWDDQGTKTQRYGINLTVNTDLYAIANNITLDADHTTGGLLDSGGAVSKSVVNNLTA